MNQTGAGEAIIEMRHITKRFPGVVANDDVSLTVNRARSSRCWAKMARANPR